MWNDELTHARDQHLDFFEREIDLLLTDGEGRSEGEDVSFGAIGEHEEAVF